MELLVCFLTSGLTFVEFNIPLYSVAIIGTFLFNAMVHLKQEWYGKHNIDLPGGVYYLQLSPGLFMATMALLCISIAIVLCFYLYCSTFSIDPSSGSGNNIFKLSIGALAISSIFLIVLLLWRLLIKDKITNSSI